MSSKDSWLGISQNQPIEDDGLSLVTGRGPRVAGHRYDWDRMLGGQFCHLLNRNWAKGIQ
jgi:hypothetical protein